MNTLSINKFNTTFNVSGCICDDRDCSINWFPSVNGLGGNWENDTFYILDYYSNKDKYYIDIGAWIGPTVLYSADKYKHIIAFEPDPVAYNRLMVNIQSNNFDNIAVINKGVSDKTGISEFGGNGKLGNSMSTLLVSLDNKEDFFNDYGRTNQWLDNEERKKNIITIQTITLEECLYEKNISIENIALIKMDIEGGEYIVIPQIYNFLNKYKPVFYISLHYVFLPRNNIIEIINMLFSIYKNCYIFDNNGTKISVSQSTVINKGLTSIVFEK